MRALSLMDVDKFLSVRAPLPELEDTAWNEVWDAEGASAYKAYAAAAVSADIGLNRLVYKCVPKRVPEAEVRVRHRTSLHSAVAAAQCSTGLGRLHVQSVCTLCGEGSFVCMCMRHACAWLLAVLAVLLLLGIPLRARGRDKYAPRWRRRRWSGARRDARRARGC